MTAIRRLQRLAQCFAARRTPSCSTGSGRPARPTPTWRALGAVLVCICAFAALPAAAGAYATTGPGPTAGIPGLPDGRVYEQVSPANKYGNSAGGPEFGSAPFIASMSEGDGALYSTSGAVGETATGSTLWATAKRSTGGWNSSSATPRPIGGQGLLNFTLPRELMVSSDLTRTLFLADAPYVKALEKAPLPLEFFPLYLAGATGQPAWMGEPLWLRQPQIPGSETLGQSSIIMGGSSDLTTVYFSAGGLYEWRDGTLSNAGVLPNGQIDPSGAFEAAASGECMNGDSTRNQVSTDGSRAFFTSGSGAESDPTELYVHKTDSDGAQSTALVSTDTLLPPVEGLPAGAPHGPIRVSYPSEAGSHCGSSGSFVYASPDGSRAFFESVDRLTADAPSDQSIKEYEFDVETGTLTYLPGVTLGTEQGSSPILGSTTDGRRFIFGRSTGDLGEVSELDMWTDGPDGPSDGQITPIAQLSTVGSYAVGPLRFADGGSVAVFQTEAPLSGFNSGGLNQVYRYDANANELTCVSCPPSGMTPSGAAYLTHDFAGARTDTRNLNSNRGVTTDGTRVYFDTPDPLVPQDVNGRRDVYEWENGSVFLISTGASREDSYFGDNSPSGGDVLFSTAQGLMPGDTDESYDVYDARIPRPGDNPPPGALPCQGDVCQGPPSVPSLLGAPGSASFNGVGNPSLHVSPTTHKKIKPKAKAPKKVKHRKKSKRAKKSHKKAGRSTIKTKGNR